MKTAIITMCKNENRYIREWVKHYNNLYFSNIIIADNNDIDGEYFDSVIGDFIENGYVIIENYRGKQERFLQHKIFEELYYKYSKDYDWIAFFDVDEFLILKEDKTINEYLSRDCFNNVDNICVNWKIFDDNDLIYYENKPVMERFTRPIEDNIVTHINNNFPSNDTFKSIIKTNKHICFKHTIHSANNRKELTFSNNKGQIIKLDNTYHYKSNFDLAQLNHYWQKTAEEFFTHKRQRGYPNQDLTSAKVRLSIGEFFKLNKKTDEKLNYIKELVYKEKQNNK